MDALKSTPHFCISVSFHIPENESAKSRGWGRFVGGVGQILPWVEWIAWVNKVLAWVTWVAWVEILAWVA